MADEKAGELKVFIGPWLGVGKDLTAFAAGGDSAERRQWARKWKIG